MPATPSAFSDALILTGPTGSGKSSLAIELAESWPLEIVAMDSMTLYRQMNIGTAKPSAADQARVPHHLLDLLEPWESGNVAWWLDRAAEVCEEIRRRGKRPLFVGGTPFYLKALLYGLFDAPPSDPVLRAQLEAEARQVGPQEFHARLAAIDPRSASRLHPNDIRRLVRAREVWELTGQPLSSLQKSWPSPSFVGTGAASSTGLAASWSELEQRCVVLDWPRPLLYHRINARVEAMLAAGWLEEVRQLRELPRPLSPEASQALGYRELFAYLEGGGHSWEATVQTIQQRTRQFAKRQLTWFRSLRQSQWIAADSPDLRARLEKTFAEFFAANR
jgi:tRNA dimethylallyltransferase